MKRQLHFIRWRNTVSRVLLLMFLTIAGASSAHAAATVSDADPGEYYFIIKANPEHFTSIKAGYSYSGPCDIDLNYSLEGEVNILTEEEYTKYLLKGNYYIEFVGKDGVEYTVTKYRTNGTTSTPFSNKVGKGKGSLTNVDNQVVIDITSVELLTEGPWTYTVIANPDHFDIREGKQTSLTIPASLTGETFETSLQFTYPQVKAKAVGIGWNAYFFRAGADTSDKSQAIAKYENKVSTSTTSWAVALYPTTLSNANFNGGTLIIESEVGIGSGNVTINIDGNPADVKVSNNGEDVSNSSSTSYTVALTNRYLTFKHATNTKYFYSLKRNDVEIAPKAQAVSGMSQDGSDGGNENTYSYDISDAKDGDVYDIVVDYPAGPWNVSINVPAGYDDFVQSVTVDGEEQTWTPGTPLSVAGGSMVRVVGDTFAYVVNQSSINGVATANPSASVSSIIADDTSFEFNLTKPDRTKSFTFTCGTLAGDLVVRTALNGVLTFESGSHEIPFCDDDNPVTFSANCTSSSTSKEYDCYWYVNGKIQPGHSLSLTHAVKDGDVVLVEFLETGTVSTGTVDFVLDGFSDYPTINGGEYELENLTGNLFFTGTTLTLSGNENLRISGITVVDADGNEVETSGLTFTVTGDCTVTVTGAPAKLVTVNVTGYAPALWAMDREVMDVLKYDFTAGSNELDLIESSGSLMLVTNPEISQYYISAVTWNGEDASDYLESNWGAYIFKPAAGDVIDITIAEKVRDLTLTVYVTGIDNRSSFSIAEKTGQQSLVVGTLQDGVNTVKYCAADLPLFVSAAGKKGYTTSVFLNDDAIAFDYGYSVNCVEGDKLFVIFESSETVADEVELGSKGMATFVSHYDCVFDEGEGAEVKAFVCTSFNESTGEAVFDRVTGTISAGTGLLLVGNITEGTLKSVTRATEPISAPAMRRASSLGENLLQGVYKDTDIPASADDDENDYYVLALGSDSFAKTAASAQSATNQAILVAPANDNNEVIVPTEVATSGVEQITVKFEKVGDGIYTLGGVKLNVTEGELAPGIYIVNGEKRIIK